MSLHQDLREYNTEEFDPTNDAGNPYKHLLEEDADADDDFMALGWTK